MGIDLQYLLFLQELREATGGIFDEFFNAISKFAVDILIFLPVFIFWCVDKKWGLRMLITHKIGEFINVVIKLTVCAYRPWIRSDQIVPAGDSKTAATGYSFPSGHTMSATSIFGTVIAWIHKKRKWIAVVCGIMIALTMFSRNFLGVHTPQDVLVGFAESVLIILIVGFFMRKLEGNEKAFDILTVIGILAVIGSLFYVIFKSYPMDYVNGELLVDPQNMMNDHFKACGGLLGLLIGTFIDRHFIKYEIPFGAKNLGLIAFVGIMIVLGWHELFGPATIQLAFGPHWGRLVSRFIEMMIVFVIWPLVIKKYAEKSK